MNTLLHHPQLKIYRLLHNFNFCKLLMTFHDFLKILLKFDEIVLFFGENFTEFRRNPRKSQLTNGNSDFFFSFFRGEDFFQNIRKIVLEF